MKRRVIFLLYMLLCINTNAQNYRNAKAYINDFGKNELFVKEALMEYSRSIIDYNPEYRTEDELERIYKKLEEINANLVKNDIGFNGDVGLRDEFMELNNKTIALLKNKTLKLNDYGFQSDLDYGNILKNFSNKEIEIAKYYSDIIEYEKYKKDFGLKYNLIVRNYSGKNVFEYDAYQNLIFYKLNVLDEKLMKLYKMKDLEKLDECLVYMNTIIKESYYKTNQMKDDFADRSLNDINVELIAFFQNQNDNLRNLYFQYYSLSDALEKQKNVISNSQDAMQIETYNELVKKYNLAKNIYFDTLFDNQVAKKQLIERWYQTNSLFLKNNIIFEDIFEKYVTEKKD
ncbi:hypothetical protein [Flavobacterium aciduliphilum]|uniref:Outer membrane efflux protein n=1 Tax=Flavobacterium aciduliphilum TaxID=1101402 RepID=A0A328Y7M9_9FLAO|nr:hypothetical protein [Flavobacterium aciduliphilum]RAR69283.1 hypothetical protein CLV55_1164 [Flavobacterium aciduliphilum]